MQENQQSLKKKRGRPKKETLKSSEVSFLFVILSIFGFYRKMRCSSRFQS